MSYLRDSWTGFKKESEEASKKNPNHQKATAAVLKSFNKGLGPKLDAVEKAAKAHKEEEEEEAKKLAKEAILIADSYAKTFAAKRSAMGGDAAALIATGLHIVRERCGAYAMHGERARNGILKK